MKIKLNSTTPDQLDWLVATCEGKIISIWGGNTIEVKDRYSFEDGYKFSPSTDWSQGGPIIERERIDVSYTGLLWGAARQLNEYEEPDEWFGPTPLIAAMRAYVASKLGDEVEIPEKLK